MSVTVWTVTPGRDETSNGEGNKQALDIIKNSKREKGFFVTVTGKLEGENISVTSIQESAEGLSTPIDN